MFLKQPDLGIWYTYVSDKAIAGGGFGGSTPPPEMLKWISYYTKLPIKCNNKIRTQFF